jgi:hypothetical protein
MKRLFTALLLFANLAAAQCVMCYRTAEAQNGARARILNEGILIMGIPPFFILGFFLYLAYRRSQTFADWSVPETPAAEVEATAAATPEVETEEVGAH